MSTYVCTRKKKFLFYFVRLQVAEQPAASLPEREGFEPSVMRLLHRRSRSIPSTTRTSFHRKYDTDKLKFLKLRFIGSPSKKTEAGCS